MSLRTDKLHGRISVQEVIPFQLQSKGDYRPPYQTLDVLLETSHPIHRHNLLHSATTGPPLFPSTCSCTEEIQFLRRNGVLKT